MSEALTLHRQGKWGQFLAAAQAALAEFPFANRATRDQLSDLIGEVNREYAEHRARVDRELRDYVAFKDLQDLADAREALRLLRDMFEIEPGEGPRGEHYAKALAEQERLEAEALRKWQSERAKVSITFAELIHEPSDEPYSAAMHYAYIKQFLPQSEQLATAEAGLKRIEEEHPDVRAVLEKLPPPEKR